MTTPKRHPAFGTLRIPPRLDPYPHVITDQEREQITESIQAGQKPSTWLIRKLLRLCDERLDIIRHLESKRAG